MKTQYILSILITLLISISTFGQAKKQRMEFDKGTIISSELGVLIDNIYSISSCEYDINIVGVASGSNTPKKLSDLIINKGIVDVKFNSENGTIKKGDPITSSTEKGVAMKATESGVILGVALEDATNSNGLVKIRIMIQYMR